jgi:hypothetical protein
MFLEKQILDEISEWLQRGESANEACARGFNEICQKPSIFEPNGIIANDSRVQFTTDY